MKINFTKRGVTIIAVGFVLLLAAVALPFANASCAQRGRDNEAATIERLRTMTRGGVLPAESLVAGIDTEYAGTRAGALARVVRARIKLAANDFAGAAALLDEPSIVRQTLLGDYALWMRAESLEKAGRRVEARAAFEQLAREFPASLRARDAILRGATLAVQDAQAAAVPLLLKTLVERDDAAALLLAARAYEQQGDTTRALGAYRRIYFYAPAPAEVAEAAPAITRLNSTTAPATADEALTRADKLFESKQYGAATDAYANAFARFSDTATPQAQLRRVIAASNARRLADAVIALNALPSSAVEERAAALSNLVQAYAKAKQWAAARSSIEEMRRVFPQHEQTMRALVVAGVAARDAKNVADASYFFRAAVASFPGRAEVAGAQFEIAWAAHESNNFTESSRLLIEHLAEYADENTDNRGRAGYWAARDSERAGRFAEARVIYEAMLERYDANWYGYLSRQRLDTSMRNRPAPPTNFAPDSPVARAVANLRPVTVAEETAGQPEEERATRADQLAIVGLDEWAHAELNRALEAAPTSPRLNLAKAKLYRARNDNVQAFNVLRKSFPDYSQMEVEELTPDEWDVFYPLAFWDIIVQESRARNLDPYTVAGLIRQESVFSPRAASHANAYGLMQLLVPTGRLVAKRYGVDRTITVESLYEPRLNIQLGTGYIRDNLDKFGRLEYVAAAYNAGPGRAAAWRASLPLEIDEWAEAIPFRETRGYVQGVVRNMLQYRRLYDEQGRFRPEVGTRTTRAAAPANNAAAPPSATDNTVRRRRVSEQSGNPDER